MTTKTSELIQQKLYSIDRNNQESSVGIYFDFYKANMRYHRPTPRSSATISQHLQPKLSEVLDATLEASEQHITSSQ